MKRVVCALIVFTTELDNQNLYLEVMQIIISFLVLLPFGVSSFSVVRCVRRVFDARHVTSRLVF